MLIKIGGSIAQFDIIFRRRNVFFIVGVGEASACASVVTESHANGNKVYFIRNSCGRDINVAWVDEGHCANRCSVGTLGPGRKTTITRPKGRYQIASCFYPQMVDRNWRGGAYYECS